MSGRGARWSAWDRTRWRQRAQPAGTLRERSAWGRVRTRRAHRVPCCRPATLRARSRARDLPRAGRRRRASPRAARTTGSGSRHDLEHGGSGAVPPGGAFPRSATTARPIVRRRSCSGPSSTASHRPRTSGARTYGATNVKRRSAVDAGVAPRAWASRSVARRAVVAVSSPAATSTVARSRDRRLAGTGARRHRSVHGLRRSRHPRRSSSPRPASIGGGHDAAPEQVVRRRPVRRAGAAASTVGPRPGRPISQLRARGGSTRAPGSSHRHRPRTAAPGGLLALRGRACTRSSS